jgi:phospholipid transport system substrate-binding protein
VEVFWHLRERLGAVRVVDVVIEGISMSLTQRSDFAASVRTVAGDLDAFLDTLEAKVRNIKPAP